jgi:uncharacterized protein YuzE
MATQSLAMKRVPLKIWYDAEADFLEVLFSTEAGFMTETDHDSVMERVNERGEILGFTVMNIRQYSHGAPLVAELA